MADDRDYVRLADRLVVGGVYRDPGDAESPPVDFIVGRLEDEPTVEGEPVLEVVHMQIGPARAEGATQPGDAGPFILGHAPISGLVDTLWTAEKVGEATLNEAFEAGYGAWREAYDADQSGVFDLRPARLYAMLLEMSQGRGPGRGGPRGGTA